MCFGGSVFVEGKAPEAYVAAHISKGYRAAYCQKAFPGKSYSRTPKT